MKIVYVINANKATGPNQVLLNMISGLQKNKKNDIFVISFLPDIESEATKLKNLGAQLINLKVTKGNIPTAGAKKLRTTLDAIKPDIIHSHGILSDIAVIRSGYAKIAVTTIHNNMFEDYIFTFGKLKGWLYIVAHLLYLRKFARVVCCSKFAAKKLQPFLSKKKLSYIHNGITKKKPDFTETNIHNKYKIPKQSRIFLYVGKLNSRKNVIQLIEEFNKNKKKEDYLLIIGDGELSKKCKLLANSHIKLLGFQSDIQSFLEKSDIYISLSHSEGFSISILEAMRTNLLLLLSDIPSHREVFEVAGTKAIGALAEPNGDIAKAMSNLDKKTSQSFAVFSKSFTDTAMMDSYYKIYKEITS